MSTPTGPATVLDLVEDATDALWRRTQPDFSLPDEIRALVSRLRVSVDALHAEHGGPR
jgi:hypothetical protein